MWFADIIALLIIGVLFLILYVLWERYLETAPQRGDKTWWTPPPLMKVSLWARAHGMLAVIFVVAFLEYGSFIIFNFWITVRLTSPLGLGIVRDGLLMPSLTAVLPELRGAHTGAYDDTPAPDVSDGACL